MADYLHRTTLQYLKSTSPADLPDGLINYIKYPDLSAVQGQPVKYWEISGDIVSLADQTTRDAIDAAELSNDRDTNAARMDDIEDITRALALATLDEINILRAQHSLNARTISQLKAATRGKLGT